MDNLPSAPDEPSADGHAPEKPAPARAGARRLRDPGGPAASLAAWFSLALLLAVTVAAQWAAPTPPGPATVEEVPSPQGPTLILARYSVGAADIAGGTGAQLLGQLDSLAAGPTDRLRVAMIAPAITEAEDGLQRLDTLIADLKKARTESDAQDAETNGADGADGESSAQGERGQAPPAQAVAPEVRTTLIADARLVRTRISEGDDALSPSEQDGLIDRHGWYAKVAVSFDQDSSDPLRQEAFGKARLVMLMLVALLAAFGAGLLVGIVLLVLAGLRVASGAMRARYAPPAPGGSAYVEAFALFIAGFLAIQVLGAALASATGGVDFMPVLIWLLLLAAAWPLYRGADPTAWRYAIGWHTGRGVFREIAAGAVGYVAGLPILAAGIGFVLLLSYLSQLLTAGPAEPPSHPVVQEVGQGGVWGLVSIYVLAAIWAPVVEETMFRGVFYHHLRGRLGALASAVAVAFVFAIIHPQGLIAVPALMSLAIVFALLREWRGSIIGPAVAHAINNGVVVTMLFVAIG